MASPLKCADDLDEKWYNKERKGATKHKNIVSSLGNTMIGRKNEIEELQRLYESSKAELVAVYGRRRVGKTYLIQETFKDRFFFKHSGLSLDDSDENKKTEIQLENFSKSLALYGVEVTKKIETWFDAFFYLEKHIMQSESKEKKVLFFDELPWMDTRGSHFISAFEGFWNGFASARDDLMIIVCGSATSWIENHLINNCGGLYGRVTYEIKLSPFDLCETKEFLESKNVHYSLYDMTQAYMIFGGIPYYLNYIDPRYSLGQNVDRLFFSKNALLTIEFDRLFDSIFTFSEKAKSIIRLLSENSLGFTRKDIISRLHLSDGGKLTQYLNALIASDFVVKYVPFGFTKRESYYKLVDPFCIFYLRFVQDRSGNESLWSQDSSSQKISAWRGYAFENVCFNHIAQIKFALGISGVSTSISSFYNKEDGYQIDLMITRKDNIINLCEIKFYSDEFKITKETFLKINRRTELLREKVAKKYSIMNTLISTYGPMKNEYYFSFANSITLEELFRF